VVEINWELTPLDPETTDQATLVGYHRLRADIWAVDYPESPAYPFDAVVSQLRNPGPEYGTCRYWAAYHDGRLIGTARAGFPRSPNAHLAFLEVMVHPGVRRNGVGTGLLSAVLPTVREQARGVVAGGGMKDDSAGASWTHGLGFTVRQRVCMQEIVIADVDPARWQVEPPAGYRLERWTGPAPVELIVSYARARQVIHDAPRGESTYDLPEWTVERVREAERELLDRHTEQLVAVAVDESTGEVAGLTIVRFYPQRPQRAEQQDTAVLKEHRGRGLGRFLKAAMTRWLVAEKPELESIYTATAADNVHMIRVNHEVGYTTTRIMRSVEVDTAELAATLELPPG
jgi:GNAT superfamily N-acetyltransferase